MQRSGIMGLVQILPELVQGTKTLFCEDGEDSAAPFASSAHFLCSVKPLFDPGRLVRRVTL